MATTDTQLRVVNSMTEQNLDTLKDNNGKIPSLANQLIMTPDEEGVGLTDVQVDDTSVVSNGVAKIVTKTAYNASSNKIATESDLPTIVDNLSSTSATEALSSNQGRVLDGKIATKGYELLQEIGVTADTNSISISGLNFTNTKEYEIVIDFVPATTTAGNVKLSFGQYDNYSVIGTNFSTFIYATANSSLSGGGSNTHEFDICPCKNDSNLLKLRLTKLNSIIRSYRSQQIYQFIGESCHAQEDVYTTIISGFYYYAGSVTSITFNLASGFKAGSKLRIYKIL